MQTDKSRRTATPRDPARTRPGPSGSNRTSRPTRPAPRTLQRSWRQGIGTRVEESLRRKHRRGDREPPAGKKRGRRAFYASSRYRAKLRVRHVPRRHRRNAASLRGRRVGQTVRLETHSVRAAHSAASTRTACATLLTEAAAGIAHTGLADVPGHVVADVSRAARLRPSAARRTATPAHTDSPRGLALRTGCVARAGRAAAAVQALASAAGLSGTPARGRACRVGANLSR
jgi:hypothetical protein